MLKLLYFKYICEMYILANIQNYRKSRFIKKQKRLVINFKQFYDLKDFIFIRYFCKMYKL